MKPSCPKCERIHSAGDVVAVGKFSGQVKGYLIRGDLFDAAVLYPARAEAEAALCERRAAR